MTTEVELCKQMIGDGIAHGIIVKVGVILVLPEWIFLNEKFLHPPDVKGSVWEAIKGMIISNFWFQVNQIHPGQIQHYTKVFL